MSTSVLSQRALVRSTGRYLAAALGCGVFAAIYEFFSHGVYSSFMVGLFAWPLVLGAVPAYLASCFAVPVDDTTRRIWALGVATCAVGSAFKGVLEIYGTASPLVAPYWIAGAILLATALVHARRALVR